VSWGCALWGLWHGLYLIVETSRPGKKLLRRSGATVRFVLTQWVVLMGWVVFRAGSLTQSAALFRVMYGLERGGARPEALVPWSDYLGRPLVLALGVGLAFCVPLAPALRRWAIRWFGPLAEANRWSRALVSIGQTVFLFALLLAVAMSLAGGTYSPFVYQQF
jgi:alginate O-acetyltransferase complex protein AlgI